MSLNWLVRYLRPEVELTYLLRILRHIVTKVAKMVPLTETTHVFIGQEGLLTPTAQRAVCRT